MHDSKKHWSEIGRVKSSAWYRALPDLEQRAVLAAVEENTFESGRALVKNMMLFFTTTAYTVALFAWGSVIHLPALAALGLMAGLAAGAACRTVLAKQRTIADLKSAQAVLGRSVLLPGAAVAAAGLVVWGASVLFHH